MYYPINHPQLLSHFICALSLMIFVASCLTSFHFILISFVMLRQVYQILKLTEQEKENPKR